MTLLRRLAYLAIVLGFAQIVFGAIVRITGSGFGCGPDWPNCAGQWIPSLTRPDLVIEVFHRYGATILSLAIVALLVAALRRRTEPGVGGRGGVLRAAAAAAALVVVIALFGMLIVKLHLANRTVVVIHLALAMALLATLVAAATRAGAFGAATLSDGVVSGRTVRASTAAVGLALVVLVLGGFTANLPGAAESCLGFPHCRVSASRSLVWWIHVTHRAAAFLLAGHVAGLAIGAGRRREALAVVRAARVALALVVAQLLIAAAMVEMQLPRALQSIHQAMGTLIWIAVVVVAVVARRTARRETGEGRREARVSEGSVSRLPSSASRLAAGADR